ncbi:alkaline phosphatase family protein [Nocardioides sp. zg-579]|uniref:Alkaline phosphatase family protein n=1 Tax=Nocardioides marmotae TaxID=2663857 RepID=A0A6I3JAC7_9ACTN|nr:nucleotide pyrophosphatase/phosphodiesterase family protein [Nocardioides marmotae]MCR6030331.1 alkaline phosphatase family protein [Gordonia jinghuaiqii]MTB93965.1 alkaline phosphatase family protein [Nocardioides marmotae]QKE00279.1 alkaline phosphatase family protein [Nocardioides marmotae]
MCAPQQQAGATTGAAARPPAATERRTVLKVAGAGGLALTFSTALGAGSPAYAAGNRDRRRAYVLVVDGCRPDEIDSGLMPNLAALRADGRHFPRAHSLPVMETLPNHVMMMTGVRPDRGGVPANEIYDRGLGETRTMDRPRDIRTTTVIERLGRRGFRTGTVLSKDYLYGVFGERATHRWEPFPLLPVTDHAPDVFTMEAALGMVEELDPHLVFVNLGDVDRVGHSDLTGGSLQALRRAALASTDLQVGRFVEMLRSTGRWKRSIVVVLADHSMDWSRPDRVVSLTSPLAADPLLAGNVAVAQNGGADLLYWTGPAKQRDRGVARMLEVARGTAGVLSAHDRARSSWLRLGPDAGDVVAYCRAGWRFSDPMVVSNPIPGNHGHPATRPIPFFVGGGHPAAAKAVSSSLAATVDVAPTIAEFFGLRGAPRGGWDGRSRI